MIHNVFRFLIFLLLSLTPIGFAAAQEFPLNFFDSRDITICPAEMADQLPPDFSSKPCKKGSVQDVDPQGTLIWVKTNIPLKATQGPNGEPFSLYISGKMSSEVYLNGVFVGTTGMPGDDAATEIPGKMDSQLFPPQNLFRIGDNEVIFRASSHNGFLRLYSPFHMVGIAPAGLYTAGGLSRLGPSLMTLGLFLLGGLYFGVMAFMGTSRTRFITLSVICLFAAGQLVSEMLRGLIPYAYPIHDLRLIAIAVFSSAFGLSVAFHVFRTFLSKGVFRIVLGLALLCTIALIAANGFDFKALLGMTLPLLASLIATGYWTYRRRERAFLYFISLLVFLTAIAIFKGMFLDTVFFLLVAFFILILFVEQALTLTKETRERQSEEARANRLEQALAQAGERTETSYINVKSAGKMERIATSQIVHCQGAGGYSELVLSGGRTVLHSATLNEIEETLPATFLRVHRSHLINVTCVKSLSRDTSGTGLLTLTEGADIPVSRRIMPKVRQALG